MAKRPCLNLNNSICAIWPPWNSKKKKIIHEYPYNASL